MTSRLGRLPPAIFAIALVVGGVAAVRFASLGLTLTHYDARGHLVVARRIFDSITPGWQQVGAVWLPLPHLLNALPIQVDAMYRTGAFAIAISIASFALATTAIVWIVTTMTGSSLAACAGALVFVLNPNLLYLQATPMTEPLLIALSVASIALLMSYCSHVAEPSSARSGPGPALVGWVFVLACMTRYEAWPVTIGALAAAVWVLVRRGVAFARASGAIGAVAIYPVAALLVFSLFSRIVVGSWFANGFFVPENPAQGRPVEAVNLIVWGIDELSGTAVLVAAAVGIVALAMSALRTRAHAGHILPLALLGSATVAWSAFVDGHPYRIRYMVPLIAVEAIAAGAAVGIWRKGRPALVPLLLAATLYDLHPFTLTAPMIAEAQWDQPNIVAREAVTRCLRDGYRGETVMASMGSLGHYMQDLSRAGFSIRDFLHEGNGDIWLNALDSPRPFAGWILIEEKAEGGDMLASIAREHPAFLDGYTRTCEAAGVALYRRSPAR